jgi:hypothetical protein
MRWRDKEGGEFGGVTVMTKVNVTDRSTGSIVNSKLCPGSCRLRYSSNTVDSSLAMGVLLLF